MSLRPTRVLLGLVLAVATMVALPAVASATISPALTITQGGTTAGSSPSVEFNATFSPSGSGSTSDSVKDLTLSFPAGLLSDETLDGGACLTTPDQTPMAACQVGSGSVTIGGTPGTALAVTLYTVAPPQPSDVAGLAVVAGSTPATPLSVADVAVGSNGALTTTFTNLLNAGISAIDTKLNALRLPTSCPTPSANVTLTADSQQSATKVSTTAPLDVTGCSGLPYSPNLTAAVVTDGKGNAEVKTDITQAAAEAASQAITVELPAGLTPNAAVFTPCLSGTPCTIGTATATSPLLSSPLNGTVNVGGSVFAPTLTITFPPPFGLSINGTVDLGTNSVTFSNVPDIPLTDLFLDLTGVNGQRAFATDCKATTITGSFTGQGGQAHTATAPISYTGCPSPTVTGTGTGAKSPSPPPAPKLKPKASGSVTGLAAGHPVVKLEVSDAGGAKIASVAIGLPAGLKFSRSAIGSHLIKGLRISGASAKSVALKAGRLVITLKSAVASVTITVERPLVTESKSLETKVKKHQARRLSFTLKVTTADHRSKSLTTKLNAH